MVARVRAAVGKMKRAWGNTVVRVCPVGGMAVDSKSSRNLSPLEPRPCRMMMEWR